METGTEDHIENYVDLHKPRNRQMQIVPHPDSDHRQGLNDQNGHGLKSDPFPLAPYTY